MILLRRSISWIIVSCAMMSLMGTLLAQVGSSREIMFLRLRLENNVITLVGTTVRPGRLKQPAGRAGQGIFYEVTSAGGESLWSGFIDDPSARRYEYEDPAASGRILTTVVKAQTAEFSLRIPVIEGARSVTFERVERGTVHGEKNSRRHLGTVSLRERDQER